MQFNRRSFIALASGLFVPDLEPVVRAYSFVGGWTLPYAMVAGNKILVEEGEYQVGQAVRILKQGLDRVPTGLRLFECRSGLPSKFRPILAIGLDGRLPRLSVVRNIPDASSAVIGLARDALAQEKV